MKIPGINGFYQRLTQGKIRKVGGGGGHDNNFDVKYTPLVKLYYLLRIN